MPSLNLIGNLNLTGNNKYNRNPFIAAGGVMNTFTSGGVNYTSHTFISGSGSFTILNGETTAQVLVVGGGGGGTAGGAQNLLAYGGGAGGVNYTGSFYFKKNPQAGGPSVWTALVGQGGLGGTNPTGVSGNPATSGSISQLYANYSYEQATFPLGGYGGTAEMSSGQGASGAGNNPTGGSAIYGAQGKAGGNGNTAGGGGAGQVGGNANQGKGGDGLAFTLQDGTLKYYGGGGGGGGFSNVGPTGGGAGGLGGGGNGGTGIQGAGQAGTANTGGGGGGGNTANDAADRGFGGNGGSGVVIICYPTNGI